MDRVIRHDPLALFEPPRITRSTPGLFVAAQGRGENEERTSPSREPLTAAKNLILGTRSPCISTQGGYRRASTLFLPGGRPPLPPISGHGEHAEGSASPLLRGQGPTVTFSSGEPLGKRVSWGLRDCAGTYRARIEALPRAVGAPLPPEGR